MKWVSGTDVNGVRTLSVAEAAGTVGLELQLETAEDRDPGRQPLRGIDRLVAGPLSPPT